MKLKLKGKVSEMIREEMPYNLEPMLAETFYGRVDPRRRQEISDSRMVREDQKAMANLPKQAIQHEYDQDRFKHACMKAGSPKWAYNELGFIRHNQKGFVGEFEE